MLRRAQLSRSSLIFALLLLFAVAAAGAQSGGHPHHAGKHARQQIEGLEEQWRAATLAGDAGALDKLLSDDYVGISWTGQVNTKAMQLDRISKRTVVISKMDLNDIKVKLLGPVAVVTSRAEVEGTTDGRVINGGFRYTRVYQRTPAGSWQITNFEATRIPPNRDHHIPDTPGN